MRPDLRSAEIIFSIRNKDGSDPGLFSLEENEPDLRSTGIKFSLIIRHKPLKYSTTDCGGGINLIEPGLGQV